MKKKSLLIESSVSPVLLIYQEFITRRDSREFFQFWVFFIETCWNVVYSRGRWMNFEIFYWVDFMICSLNLINSRDFWIVLNFCMFNDATLYEIESFLEDCWTGYWMITFLGYSELNSDLNFVKILVLNTVCRWFYVDWTKIVFFCPKSHLRYLSNRLKWVFNHKSSLFRLKIHENVRFSFFPSIFCPLGSSQLKNLFKKTSKSYQDYRK